MRIEYAAIASGVVTALGIWYKAQAIYGMMVKIATPLIKEVEARAKDGKIDKADRKAIVMLGIKEAEASGKIRLNFITRKILSWVVDYIAGKLPDFNISQGVVEIVNKAQANVNNKAG